MAGLLCSRWREIVEDSCRRVLIEDGVVNGAKSLGKMHSAGLAPKADPAA